MQLQEFRTDLSARMSASKITGFWKDSDKDRWINKAIVRACNYARWKFLSKHSSQLTELNSDGSGKESYFLPFDFKPGGMIFLSLDKAEYHKVGEETYLSTKSNNDLIQNIFTIIGDEFFLNPVPTEAGKIIDFYYKRRPVRLVEDTDEPITPEEMDEAIVKLALSVCLSKIPGKKAESQQEVIEAHTMLAQVKEREDEEPSSVFKGQATSSRWS